MKNFEHDFILPPFPAFPSASRFVELGPVLDTFSRVSRSILAREAIALIIGPPGTGKSLVCSLLAKEFASTHDIVSLGETTITDEASFHRYLLHRLGVALEPGRREDLELLVYERLCGDQSKPNGVVLLIDEASSLSTDVLEAIRRLTNLMREGQPVVTAVVAGGVKLDETLTSPSMESFVQRVTARCYLHPLNADEARQYIRQSIQACEASPDETITDKAISAIYHASCGVPRLINQLMTEAIDCAADLNESLIDEHTINKAWASLQQLPSPMTEEPEMKPESSIVEFGELIDPLPMAQESDSVDTFKTEMVAESIERAEQETDALLNEVVFEDDALDTLDAVERTAAEPCTDPATLFGDFDNEEQIEVGAAQMRSRPSEPSNLDIESMLHSQIVSLSQFAAENTTSRYADLDSLAMFKECPAEDTADATPEEMELVAETVEHDSDQDSDNFPAVVWYDEPAAEDAAQVGEKHLRDDTDLLWITEDIDVDRRVVKPSDSAVTPHRVDQPAPQDPPKLKVDYREILEKMRSQA